MNEHFQQWTKDEALIGKYKLYGRISQTMPKGDYNLLVGNNYKISKLRLKKGVEILVPSSVGGPVYFFPISFLIMGLMCLGYVAFLKYEIGDYDLVADAKRKSQL
jgi:hypothetical protein